MIRVMKQSRTRKAFPLDVFVRSNPRCKQALDETLASIRGSDRLRLSSQRFSQEALVNALWLWARKKIDNEGVEVLEDELLPHVETLNAMLESAERTAPQGGASFAGKAQPGPRRFVLRCGQSSSLCIAPKRFQAP